MAFALNNLQRVDMPLNKETKPKQTNIFLIILFSWFIKNSDDHWFISLILVAIIWAWLKKQNRNELVHLQRNKRSSGIRVTDSPGVTKKNGSD